MLSVCNNIQNSFKEKINRSTLLLSAFLSLTCTFSVWILCLKFKHTSAVCRTTVYYAGSTEYRPLDQDIKSRQCQLIQVTMETWVWQWHATGSFNEGYKIFAIHQISDKFQWHQLVIPTSSAWQIIMAWLIQYSYIHYKSLTTFIIKYVT